jgi:hypothetical protein
MWSITDTAGDVGAAPVRLTATPSGPSPNRTVAVTVEVALGWRHR